MKKSQLIPTIHPTHLIIKATFEYDSLLLDFVKKEINATLRIYTSYGPFKPSSE